MEQLPEKETEIAGVPWTIVLGVDFWRPVLFSFQTGVHFTGPFRISIVVAPWDADRKGHQIQCSGMPLFMGEAEELSYRTLTTICSPQSIMRLQRLHLWRNCVRIVMKSREETFETVFHSFALLGCCILRPSSMSKAHRTQITDPGLNWASQNVSKSGIGTEASTGNPGQCLRFAAHHSRF
jgi:hypothetical protein